MKGPKPNPICKRGHDKRIVGMHGRNCAECTRTWLRKRYAGRSATDFIPAAKPDRITFFHWQQVLQSHNLGMYQGLSPWKLFYFPDLLAIEEQLAAQP